MPSTTLTRTEIESLTGVGPIDTEDPCLCGAIQPAHYCSVEARAKRKLLTALHAAMGDVERVGDEMACVLDESEYAENRLLAHEWWAAQGRCRVCHGPLEGAPGPECADDGCPSRDGSDA